jgi:hypothetical protein
MVNELHIIKKEPNANTVPGNHNSVALNIDPKETGPNTKRHQNQEIISSHLYCTLKKTCLLLQ